jgi:hypothetical protein
MILKARSGLLILMPLVAACATLHGSDNPTALQRAEAEQVEVLQSAPGRPYKSLGAVKGSGCLKSTFDINIPEADALHKMKLQAATRSADAIMNTACRNATIDWFTNCFNLIECTGEAIKFLDK